MPDCARSAAGPGRVSVYRMTRNANHIFQSRMHTAQIGPLGCAPTPGQKDQTLLRSKRLFCAPPGAPSWHVCAIWTRTCSGSARTARVSMDCCVRAQTALAARPRNARLRTQPRVLLLERLCQSLRRVSQRLSRQRVSTSGRCWA